jgi:uncharacterized membrane protein
MRLKEEDIFLMLVGFLTIITTLLAVNLVIQDNSKAGIDNRHEVIEQFEMECEYDIPTYEI